MAEVAPLTIWLVLLTLLACCHHSGSMPRRSRKESTKSKSSSAVSAVARRRRASENQTMADSIYASRSIQDWKALSRPALLLLINQYHLSAGTNDVMADRLFAHFNSNERTNGVNPLITTVTPSQPDITNLREELSVLVTSQIDNAMEEMRQLITNIRHPETNSSIPAPALPIISQPTLYNADTDFSPLTVPATNNFILPSLSATNLASIKSGKFISFDSLLPASIPHSTSGYSLQVDNASCNDNPSISLLPRTSRRIIKNFASWISAWNIFIQAFSFYHPGFVGSLLAYQSQISLYASRYEFNAWSTYDRYFRQNMANLHPVSPWGDIDRRLFDEILLCASVLAVCYVCRESGHYASVCPSRSPSSVAPFRAPQQAASSTPLHPRPHFPTPPSSAMCCRTFNAGTPCRYSPCRFTHACSTCHGAHPASRCSSSKS